MTDWLKHAQERDERAQQIGEGAVVSAALIAIAEELRTATLTKIYLSLDDQAVLQPSGQELWEEIVGRLNLRGEPR